MSTAYTTAEIWTRIRAIDTELDKLLLSSTSGGPALRTPLDYTLGEKKIDLSSRVKALQSEKQLLMSQLAASADAPVEKWTPVDYEVNAHGEQLGDEIDGSE